ncbi:3-methyl-2-oxobutanoate hydroxymethyltransferase [Streptomyces winkii]|uniref:3-methyl-2-oxobutanoate hydroxymethyltransferase n=1 Tax=Streptomyces winkii TaxID=3051178 RepID=UPI0028D4EA31|nr:3-methyl-2-oxobutanoate hydroxymethyltransferase [Streptomyces sp. DSM 40971]
MGQATVQLSESARAASAHEAGFRIDVPIAPARSARIVALDDRAAGVARRLAALPWAGARFYTAVSTETLRQLDDTPVPLDGVIARTDVVVVLATEDRGHRVAAEIGRICGERAITTAGVVLGEGFEVDEAVAALRPYARVLLLSADESDVVELLTALRV